MRRCKVPARVLALVVIVLAAPAGAEDSRIEKARQIRDEILARRAPARLAREDGFAAQVESARSRLAAIDLRIENNRRLGESQTPAREKLAARAQQLAAQTERIQGVNRARIEAIYRSAKLGAGAAGWNPDRSKSARLSRYLAAISGVQQQALSRIEVEHGSVIAALDRGRAEDAAAAEQMRALDADRLEAQAAVDRAENEAVHRPPRASEEEAAGDDGAATDAETTAALEIEKMQEAARKLAERSAAAASAQNPTAANAAPAASGDDFRWPAPVPVDAAKTAAAAAAARNDAATAKPAEASKPATQLAAAAAPTDEHPDLEEGPAVLAPSGSAAATPAEASPAAGTTVASRPKGILTRLFGDDADSDKFATARGSLPVPVAGKVVANYGQQHKNGATYRGVILRATHDAPIHSVAQGRVSFVGTVPGLGSTVIVSHGGRYHTVYARLGSVEVKEGDRVSGGTEVGSLPADDSDLHFELRDNGKAIDPLPWLKGVPGAAP